MLVCEKKNLTPEAIIISLIKISFSNFGNEGTASGKHGEEGGGP